MCYPSTLCLLQHKGWGIALRLGSLPSPHHIFHSWELLIYSLSILWFLHAKKLKRISSFEAINLTSFKVVMVSDSFWRPWDVDACPNSLSLKARSFIMETPEHAWLCLPFPLLLRCSSWGLFGEIFLLRAADKDFFMALLKRKGGMNSFGSVLNTHPCSRCHDFICFESRTQ